jgi:hypothetical protein
VDVDGELRRCFDPIRAIGTPLALRAAWDADARRQLHGLDQTPPSAEDEARMAAMTFASVWNRAIMSAFYTRLSLQSALQAGPKRAKTKRGQHEIAYYRDRVAALDDTLLGLAFARQRISAVSSSAEVPEARSPREA